MDKPIVGRAMVPPMVAMIVVGSVSGSLPLMFAVGFAMYPFVHLWFRWVAYRSKQSANFCKRTGVRGWF